jgi:hypothetical protein
MSLLTELETGGFEIYAKTGTLEAEGAGGNTTRLVMAMVKYADAEKTRIDRGLVFSIFAQQTAQGTATRWLGEFLVQYRGDIHRLLGYSPGRSGESGVKGGSKKQTPPANKQQSPAADKRKKQNRRP